LLSPNGITTVLFDLDGTLRHSRPSYNEAFCDFACQLGMLDEPESRRNAMRWLHYYWAQSPELVADRESFRDRHEDFWTNHARLGLLALGASPERAQALAPALYRKMADGYSPENWIPADVPETLQHLKEAGFTLGVVSNRTLAYEEELATLGLQAYFDCVVAAGLLQVWKPQPAIFRHALEQLGVTARESMYVGDNYYADAIGAQQAGLRAVLLDPDGIFPEAECAVIRTMSELAGVLEK
jgi:HAD superfamily hydrolase (TIGR01549 family)